METYKVMAQTMRLSRERVFQFKGNGSKDKAPEAGMGQADCDRAREPQSVESKGRMRWR